MERKEAFSFCPSLAYLSCPVVSILHKLASSSWNVGGCQSARETHPLHLSGQQKQPCPTCPTSAWHSRAQGMKEVSSSRRRSARPYLCRCCAAFLAEKGCRHTSVIHNKSAGNWASGELLQQLEWPWEKQLSIKSRQGKKCRGVTLRVGKVLSGVCSKVWTSWWQVDCWVPQNYTARKGVKHNSDPMTPLCGGGSDCLAFLIATSTSSKVYELVGLWFD